MTKSSANLLAMRDIPRLLAEAVHPEQPDEGEQIGAGVLRESARQSFKRLLELSIEDGDLVQRSHAGIPFSADFAYWHGGYVSRADLQRYLNEKGIRVELGSVSSQRLPASDASLDIQYRVQDLNKQLAGRYTLEEAASILESQAGERFETVLDRLKSAAESSELPMYDPGENVRRDYEAEKTNVLRDFYEETHWDDLNAWIEEKEPRVQFRFPEPGVLNDQRLGKSADDFGPQRKVSDKHRALYCEALEACIDLIQTDQNATAERILNHLRGRSLRWKATKAYLDSFSTKGWEKAISRAGGFRRLKAEAWKSLRA